MMGAKTACVMLKHAMDEMQLLCLLREEGAPVEEDIMSMSREMKRYLDAICDAMGAGA